jgi:hypothetical protein
MGVRYRRRYTAGAMRYRFGERELVPERYELRERH